MGDFLAPFHEMLDFDHITLGFVHVVKHVFAEEANLLLNFL